MDVFFLFEKSQVNKAYKLGASEDGKRNGGVIQKKKLAKNVLELRRLSDAVMKLKLIV